MDSENKNSNVNIRVGLGVFVIIFNLDFSKVLLLKRNEEKRKKWDADWRNIGGKMEVQEHSHTACLREAREEIGVELDKEKVKLIHVSENPNFNPGIHAVHFVYATAIAESTPIKINGESDSYAWFNVNMLPDRMIDKSEFIIEMREKAMEILK